MFNKKINFCKIFNAKLLIKKKKKKEGKEMKTDEVEIMDGPYLGKKARVIKQSPQTVEVIIEETHPMIYLNSQVRAFEDPFVELEAILADARSRCVMRTKVEDIAGDLARLGVCFVKIKGEDPRIRLETAKLMNETFGTSITNGDFTEFLKKWTGKAGVTETGVEGVSNRMPNKSPIASKFHETYKLSEKIPTIHRYNPLNAMINVRLWTFLPEFHPSKWYKKDDLLVTEDGIKISDTKSYKPTGLHYDGQLGAFKEGQLAPRVQVAYVEDEGPACLFAIPGSNSDRARELILQITKQKGVNSGFVTFKKMFPKEKKSAEESVEKKIEREAREKEIEEVKTKLFTLLVKYGVSLNPGPGIRGLIMFNSNVWHYEAGAVNQGNGLAFYSPDAKTATSKVFRIYCGVIAISKETEKEKDKLIQFAYLRLKGWTMDPFASTNKREPTFVNYKHTQSYPRALESEDKKAFDAIKNVSMTEMKAFLQKQNEEILFLLGLNKNDLLVK